MRKAVLAATTALMSFALAAFALVLSFSLLLTPLPTHVLSGWFADEGPSGYSHEQMVEVADNVLRYSLGDDDVQFPQGTDETTSIDEASLAHLRDCRVIFRGVISVAICLGVVLALAFAALGLRRERATASRSLIGGCVIAAAAMIACVIAAALDFGSFFDWAHSLFFEGGSWFFSADSLMICALPTKFWIGMGILWALLIAALCVLYVIIARKLRRN